LIDYVIVNRSDEEGIAGERFILNANVYCDLSFKVRSYPNNPSKCQILGEEAVTAYLTSCD
jgi:hypothetical protein